MQLIKISALLFVFSLTSSCGWQLRDSAGVNSETDTTLTNLHVGANLPKHQQGPQSVLRVLDRRLSDLDINSAKSRSDAQLGVVILAETNDESVLSLTSDLFEQQIRLNKTIEYQVWQGDNLLVENESVTTFRDLTQDQSRAAAKNREANLIAEEMNLDLANQLIRRLQLYNAGLQEDPNDNLN